jgi:EpsD family peptidyl-prolyl cis-trans isomerase
MLPEPLNQSFQCSTRSIALVAAAVVAALALSGCADKAKSATQVAAKVNKAELSIHQINHQLERQHGLRPEQADIAGRQILERLIDQELAVQRAEELKIDRDPAVLQAIDAARREIISRAYLDRVSEAASRPTVAEVKQYFDDMPALFRERRLYDLREISIEAQAEQLESLSNQLKTTKDPSEYMQYLRSRGINFSSNSSMRPAEHVPLSMLAALARMKDGEAILTPTRRGADVLFFLAAHLSPIDETKARPAIEQFLLNERKRQLVENDLKALRTAGKIQYVGKFAAAPAATAAELPRTPAAGAPAAESDVDKRTSGLK